MTENDIIKVGKILKLLGIDLDVSTFVSRLRVQKIVYILKEMGIDLKYTFYFYRHGVYSQELQNDFLRYSLQLPDLSSKDVLNDDEIAKLNRFKKVDYLNNEILEAISTIIHYGLTYKNQDDVIERIRRIKPHLSHDTILFAQNYAKMLFFNEEYLTDEIKEEMQIWDDFSGNPTG